MVFKTLNNLPENARVLLRLDLNAPVSKHTIIDGPRFVEAVETLFLLLKKKATVTILAHQGRKGGADFLPLKQHATLLSKHLKKPVTYIPDLFGSKARKAIEENSLDSILLLENVRFSEDETSLETTNYKALCSLFDYYMNDAFSVCHRKQGSIILPPKYLSSYAGPHLEAELKAINQLVTAQKKRLVYLIGGAKADDYFPLCNSLRHKHTRILASGVFANLFLIASGTNLGYENVWSEEKGYEVFYPELKKIQKAHHEQIILPIDVAIGPKDLKKAVRCEMSLSNAPFQEKIWDVGPATITLFKKYLADADAVFMKGPLGYSEIPAFSYGTTEMLKYLAELTQKGAYTFLGGGHLTTTLETYHLPKTFSHISTSGGSLMHALAGKKLPGVEALKKSKQ